MSVACCQVPDVNLSAPDVPSGDVDVKVSAPDMPSADVDASLSAPDVPSVDIKAPKKGIFGKLLHKKASKASVEVCRHDCYCCCCRCSLTDDFLRTRSSCII